MNEEMSSRSRSTGRFVRGGAECVMEVVAEPGVEGLGGGSFDLR